MVTRLLEQRFTIKPYSPVIKLPALSFLEKQWKKPWSPTSHQGPQADILKALGGAAQAGGRVGAGSPLAQPRWVGGRAGDEESREAGDSIPGGWTPLPGRPGRRGRSFGAIFLSAGRSEQGGAAGLLAALAWPADRRPSAEMGRKSAKLAIWKSAHKWGKNVFNLIILFFLSKLDHI